jgi:hypothetical protein
VAALIKNVVKDFNKELLHEEMDAAGLLGGSLLWAGFDRIDRRIYTPSTVHGFTAGDLHFEYEPPLTAPQETALDNILAAHDHTQLSKFQAHKQTDEQDRQDFIQTFNDWPGLTVAQQLNRTRRLFRVVARLLDSSTDI